jgi:hypothetical protein
VRNVGRKTLAETALLEKGLTELSRRDWFLNAKLAKAIRRKDALLRQQRLLAVV